MATESPLIHDGTQQAGADLSTKQFYAAKITGSRTVGLASAGGEAIYGIIQNKPTLGQAADIGILGVSKAAAGNTFAAGALLMTDGTGRLITATSTNHVVAQALEASTAAGAVVSVTIGLGSSNVIAP
jgi:hypothetical protein